MISMVTDRTELDVIQGNSKGVYSHTDLNRVESAVAELFELANGMGFSFTEETKTDWTTPRAYSRSTWPASSQMERYLSNVKALAAAFSVSSKNVPASMSDLTYQGANAIEKCLESIYAAVEGTTQNYRYSGEFYAGEEFCL